MVMLLLFAAFVRLCMLRLLRSLALAVSVEAGILFTHFVWNFKHISKYLLPTKNFSSKCREKKSKSLIMEVLYLDLEDLKQSKSDGKKERTERKRRRKKKKDEEEEKNPSTLRRTLS